MPGSSNRDKMYDLESGRYMTINDDCIAHAINQACAGQPKFLKTNFSDNLDVMNEAVSRKPILLAFGSKAVRSNYDICRLAVTSDGMSLQYVSESLQRDESIVLLALASNLKSIRYCNCWDSDAIIEYLIEHDHTIHRLKEYLQESLHQRTRIMNRSSKYPAILPKHHIEKYFPRFPFLFYFLTDSQKGDRSVQLKAIRNGYSLNDILRDLKEMCGGGYEDTKYYNALLRSDPEICIEAIKRAGAGYDDVMCRDPTNWDHVDVAYWAVMHDKFAALDPGMASHWKITSILQRRGRYLKPNAIGCDLAFRFH